MMDNSMREVVDEAIMVIALNRRATEIFGEDVDEYDRELNVMSKKWHDKFKDMSKGEMVMFMFDQMLEKAAEKKRRGRE